jgi:hypothetical protein
MSQEVAQIQLDFRSEGSVSGVGRNAPVTNRDMPANSDPATCRIERSAVESSAEHKQVASTVRRQAAIRMICSNRGDE